MGRHRIDDSDIYTGEDKGKREKAHRLRIASRKCYEKDPLKKGAHYVRKRLLGGHTVKQKTLEKYKQYLDPRVYNTSD
tara:strand:+ start:506 stop:739 length:234 start_codon:yes stop_codon:yes gene_type:complete